MIGTMLIAAALVVVVLFSLRFSAGARLAQDPRQAEVVRLLIWSVQKRTDGRLIQDERGRWLPADGAPSSFLDGFREAVAYVRETFKDETPHERKLRLMQALSVAQRHVSANDYDLLRMEVAHFRG